MSMNFLDHIRDIEDPRIPGMVLYPLDEVLLTVLVGLLCRAEDVDEIEDICMELLDWLRLFLPFERGIAPAQTLRRTLARLDPRRLEEAFAAWTARLTERVRGVVAVDGKTVRGSKQDADGKGALHLVSAYAHEAGLILAQQAVDGKSNEITAIPELLDMLALEGAIVTIDAMGTQKEIAARIVARKADYVLALKGNQGTLEEDAALFFADPVLAADCPCHEETTSGHGRIEERTVRAAGAAWLAERHTEWKGRSRASSPSRRVGQSRRPGRPRPRHGSTSPPCRPIPSASPPPCAPTGASRTISTGRSMWRSARTRAASARITPPATSP